MKAKKKHEVFASCSVHGNSRVVSVVLSDIDLREFLYKMEPSRQ